jgi:YD repeat-containing protein
MKNEAITISTIVNSPIETVWSYWNEPQHITQWAFATDTWHAPHATNDLKAGGTFTTRMEAKDGSFGFDFSGTYDEVVTHELISYTLADGRSTKIEFIAQGNRTKIIETFDPENQNPIDMQKAGWQAILDNFKKYVER